MSVVSVTNMRYAYSLKMSPIELSWTAKNVLWLSFMKTTLPVSRWAGPSISPNSGQPWPFSNLVNFWNPLSSSPLHHPPPPHYTILTRVIHSTVENLGPPRPFIIQLREGWTGFPKHHNHPVSTIQTVPLLNLSQNGSSVFMKKNQS